MIYHLKTTKNFDKQYAKLPPKIKTAFEARLDLFVANPFDSALRNHALKGKYLGFRSIDVTGDFRALYKVEDGVVYIFAFIGSHSQLY
jgi:addiction module RelE/StbE family toxin